MPVKKCSNGKWRIGSGDCMYDTKETAEKAYAGYRASKYANESEYSTVEEQMRYMLNQLDEEISPATDEEYDELTRKNFYQKSPAVVDMATQSKEALQQFYPNGELKTMKSGSGNFVAQWYETADEIFLVGINTVQGKIRREDVGDLKRFIDMLISAMQGGKTLYTSPHKRSMQMLNGVKKKAEERGLNFSMQQSDAVDFGDGTDPELQFYQVTAQIT